VICFVFILGIYTFAKQLDFIGKKETSSFINKIINRNTNKNVVKNKI
jgi:hypothetical protein